MRTLIVLFVGLFIVGAILLVNYRAARRAVHAQPNEPPPDNESNLSDRLDDAARTFGAAGVSMGTGNSALKTALADLAQQCTALSQRAAIDSGFARMARPAIIRLLFALYEVVERVSVLTRNGATEGSNALLISASGLIANATEALGGIADRADETTLRHLEADLEVLRDQLKQSK